MKFNDHYASFWNHYIQGPHRSWKPGKVLEFDSTIPGPGKVLEFCQRSLKIVESPGKMWVPCPRQAQHHHNACLFILRFTYCGCKSANRYLENVIKLKLCFADQLEFYDNDTVGFMKVVMMKTLGIVTLCYSNKKPLLRIALSRSGYLHIGIGSMKR